MGDLIIFALLFATYITMLPNTAGGPGPADLFNLRSVAMQTGILLVSSLCMGMAMLALKYRAHRQALLGWLALTAVLGIAFLFFEVSDFMVSAAKGGVPSRSRWLSAYYSLVGLHGVHIAVGVGWIALMAARIGAAGLTEAVATRLLRLSLFWHFLDIVWITIFTVVYLAGVA